MSPIMVNPIQRIVVFPTKSIKMRILSGCIRTKSCRQAAIITRQKLNLRTDIF
ncbi:hypothetical protein QNK12_29450 [Neobacillus cucumis]|nr:hypothetical protein QNK12_29450 [Neobacillus cucumis]